MGTRNETLAAYRRDAREQHLSAAEREKLVKPYLPSRPPVYHNGRASSPKDFLREQLHFMLFTLVHLIFSAYIRLRQTYHALIDRVLAIRYYHHRSPELIRKDVGKLERLPDHLSVILSLKEDETRGAGLERLIDEVAEISAWCACAGIPMLSVYERSGKTMTMTLS